MTTESQNQRFGLTIGTKLAAISIVTSMAAVSIAAVLAGYSSNEALKRAAFERLTAVRELKAQQIEGYFSQVENELNFIAESASLKEHLQQLRRGVVYLKTSDELITSQSQENLTKYYFQDFLQRYQMGSGSTADDTLIDGLHPRTHWRFFCRTSTSSIHDL